jgi:predicted alpha-1,2-mannosidase
MAQDPRDRNRSFVPGKDAELTRLESVPYARLDDAAKPDARCRRASLRRKRTAALTASVLITTISAFAFLLRRAISAASFTQYVDCLIGTGGHGQTFLGASVPFGAVQLGPSGFPMGWDWCSGYHHSDSTIVGFPHTHLSGTGTGDYGDILVMPYRGPLRLSAGDPELNGSGYFSRFSHATERCRPGYYSVLLSDTNIAVELTATAHCGFHRYTFKDDGGPCRVIVDLIRGDQDVASLCAMSRRDRRTIVGFRNSAGWANDQMVYFALQTQHPVADFEVFKEDVFENGTARKVWGVFTFDRPLRPFLLKVGLSAVSFENALQNLLSEIPHWDFDRVRKDADRQWNEFLGRVTIETRNLTDKIKFYSALYHTAIHPSVFSDTNGEYPGNDRKVYKSNSEYHTVFSLWDTYRAAHPLYTLLYPTKSGAFVDTLLRLFNQTGLMPVWQLWTQETDVMSGVSSIQVVAEAYLKDVPGFDHRLAFAAMMKEANRSRRGMEFHKDFKFIPCELQRQPVANALEFCVSEASIALVAKRMGKQFEYEYYRNRSFNYELYYDSDSGFFRGRFANWSWYTPFDPFKSMPPASEPYGEGTAWIYLWHVPHDVDGLIEMLGGEERALMRLREFFKVENSYGREFTIDDLTGTIGQYAHGNEPTHHIIYLFPYFGVQWEAARHLNFVFERFYTDTLGTRIMGRCQPGSCSPQLGSIRCFRRRGSTSWVDHCLIRPRSGSRMGEGSRSRRSRTRMRICIYRG